MWLKSLSVKQLQHLVDYINIPATVTIKTIDELAHENCIRHKYDGYDRLADYFDKRQMKDAIRRIFKDVQTFTRLISEYRNLFPLYCFKFDPRFSNRLRKLKIINRTLKVGHQFKYIDEFTFEKIKQKFYYEPNENQDKYLRQTEFAAIITYEIISRTDHYNFKAKVINANAIQIKEPNSFNSILIPIYPEHLKSGTIHKFNYDRGHESHIKSVVNYKHSYKYGIEHWHKQFIDFNPINIQLCVQEHVQKSGLNINNERFNVNEPVIWRLPKTTFERVCGQIMEIKPTSIQLDFIREIYNSSMRIFFILDMIF